MKIHRFYLEDFTIKDNNCLLNSEYSLEQRNIIHQCFNVLKLRTGESVILFNEKKEDCIFNIKDISKTNIILSFIKEIKNIKQNSGNVFLHLPLIKKDNFYLILEKCTEIGIVNFCPLITDRTEKKNIESFIKDMEKQRLKEILIQAVEQSGQGLLPIVLEKDKLKDSISDLMNYKDNMVFILDFGGEDLKTFIMSFMEQALDDYINNIHIFIGPEGGWSEEERSFFKSFNNDNNLKIVSLGSSVLRAETACFLSSYLLIK